MEASALPRPRRLAHWPGARLRAADDADLVNRVRAGDEAAFEVAYDRHHRGILAFCRHMLGSREEAEDALQHTFIAAYRDLVGSDKRIQLKPWLYTIARNRCLSILRARREQVALDDVEPATEGLSAQVERRQDLREMLADLASLPDDQREALVLAEIGALSHEEIAMTLDVRKEKVKALVFQARESLTSSKKARDTDCQEIQEQLAVLRGGSLRRTMLRRHVEHCPACAAYKAEVARQRAALGAILPVVPSLALKETVLAAAFGSAKGVAAAGALGAGASVGAGSAGGTLGGLTAKGLATKALTVVAVGGGATGAGIVATDQLGKDPSSAIAGEARIAPRPAHLETPDRGVAAKDGTAAPVVASLRDRAKQVAVQRQTDRRAAGAVPATTSQDTPPPLNPAAIAPVVVGGEDAGESRGKAKGHDKDKANGKAKGHDKDKDKAKGKAKGPDKDKDKANGEGKKDQAPGRSGDAPRGRDSAPGQTKKQDGGGEATPKRSAGAGRRAPRKSGTVRVPAGETRRGGAKKRELPVPGRTRTKPRRPAKSRVPAPSLPSPAAPPAPKTAPPDATTPGKVIDGVKETVQETVPPEDGKAKQRSEPQPGSGGPVSRAKKAVAATLGRILPF